MEITDNSVIICNSSPESALKKTKGSPEKTKQTTNRKKVKQKARKKTYYENALKHIQGSASSIHSEILDFTRAVTERTQRYTARNIVKQKKQKLQPLLPEVDFGPDDSVITLSDNESEIILNTSKPTNSADKGTKNNEQSKNKSRKQKSMNASCFIVSEDEDFDNTILLDADGENKAPEASQQGGTNNNHAVEDIEVIWSSMKTSTKKNKQSKSSKNKESERKQIEKVSRERLSRPERNSDNSTSGNLILLSEGCIVPRSGMEPPPRRELTSDNGSVEPERPRAPIQPPGPAVNHFQHFQSQSVSTISYTTQTRFDNTMPWDQAFYNRCAAPVNPVPVNSYFPNNMTNNVPSNIANNVPSNMANNFPSNIPNNMANTIPSNIPNNMANNIQSNIPNNMANNIPSNIMSNMPNNIISNIPNNIVNNIPNNILSNIPNNIVNNIPNNIVSNIPNNIVSTIPNNIVSTIPNNIVSTIPNNIVSTIPNNIVSNLPNNIANNVPSNMNNVPSLTTNNMLNVNISNKFPRNPILREVIIDGNNVGMAYTNGKTFSERGVELVVDYFQKLGHVVKVFIPNYRRSQNMHPLLERYYSEGIVVYTPSRQINGKRITPYDDRYIIEYANLCGGIIVSSDQYRDLYWEKPIWRQTIEKRLLMPTFVGDLVMFPEDPLGRGGPKLEVFLRHLP